MYSQPDALPSTPVSRFLQQRPRLQMHLSGLAAAAAGALLPLGFAPFACWPLGIICPALLLLLLHNASARARLWRCALFAGGFFSVGASWVYVSIHDFGAASVPLATLLTGAFVLVLTFFFSLPFYLYGRYSAHRSSHHSALFVWLFPCLWILAEWVRSWVFTGFPWLLLGYTQLGTPLAGFAPVLGIYGVGLMTLLVAAALVAALTRRQPGWLALPLVLLGSGWGLQQVAWTRAAGEPIAVALVQANIPQSMKWDPAFLQPTLEKYAELSEPLWADHDWIIWPEAAVPLTYHRALPFLNQMYARASDANATLMTGILYDDPDHGVFYNSVLGLGNGSGIFHKEHLVPFGEYVPLEQWLRQTIQFFNLPTSYITPGPAGQRLLQAGELRVAPALCYEIVYADLVAERAAGAEVILTISNDAWFGDSLGPQQHMQMAQMRALENGRYVIRSTNNGITGVINPQGVIEAQIPQFVSAILRSQVTAHTGTTPYTRWGSAPTLVLVSLGLLLLLWRSRR